MKCSHGAPLLMLLMRMLMAHAQAADALSLRVVPDRLQFFEYESVGFACEDSEASGGWRVMRRVRGVDTICGSTWETSGGRCDVPQLFLFDSGAYWCQAEGGRRSDSVQVAVTDGPVILESPAHPVVAGADVVLRCRTNGNSSDSLAEFYRNGSLLATGYRGQIRIRGVSASDQGLYRCDVAGSGGSAESRLAVADEPPVDRGAHFRLWFPVIMGLLLLLMLAAHVFVSSRVKKRQAAEARTAWDEDLRSPAAALPLSPSSSPHIYHNAEGTYHTVGDAFTVIQSESEDVTGTMCCPSDGSS